MAPDRIGPDEVDVTDGRILDPLRAALGPALAGFDIVGWNRQAEATGGDFFEFQEVSGGCLAITVADVCGRGAGAAAVVDECRAALHASIEATEEPAQVAERVNRLLCTGTTAERFVTAFFGRLDHQGNRLCYLSAGHGPVWFYSQEQGRLSELEVHGYPLALEAEERFAPPGVVSFAPGDFVVVVTDGFYEWVGAQGESFGTARVCAQILQDRDRSASEIIGGLHRALLDFAAGAPQVDDLTAVVIKRRL